MGSFDKNVVDTMVAEGRPVDRDWERWNLNMRATEVPQEKGIAPTGRIDKSEGSR